MKSTVFRHVLSAVLASSLILQILPPAVSQIKSQTADLLSTSIVISQVYGAGGNSGATYQNDYIELFNRGTQSVSLSGWSVQYTSATGTGNFSGQVTQLSGSLAPGQYYLVQQSGGATGLPLPPPDATGTVAMAAGAGKVIVANVSTGIPCNGSSDPCSPSELAQIVDLVGYGNANFFEGSGAAPTLSATLGAFRGAGGCTETDNNSADFTATTPNPRNTSSTLNPCGGTTNPTGTGLATPNSLPAGGSTLLTVAVTPGSVPPSTGLVVSADLTAIGGGNSQAFFDDGTNGDTTVGDNTFSFQTTVAPGTPAGAVNLPALISDEQTRTGSANIALTVTAPRDPQAHLTMGNPSEAVMDENVPTNYLLTKDAYAMSYHRDRGTANWISWNLDPSWLGSAPRQDDYRPDPQLPAAWYHVLETDYSGSGFDRGHHCPSGDRTATIPENSATFLMTNMMPQSPNNNQGPWERLETFSRNLVTGGNELYTVTGGAGIGGTGSNGFATTIANGNVTVPAYTWKVILVLPNGVNDLARVDSSTRTIAVIMPNKQGIQADEWQKYLATVDQVEALTGYDFFSNVSPSIQAVIESVLDPASNTAPQSLGAGTFANLSIDAPNTTLTGDVTVNGVLTLGGSKLVTNGNRITLGPNATVSRISGYVDGNFEKQFEILGSPLFEYPVGTSNGYSPVNIELTALGTVPSSLTVRSIQGVHPSAPNPSVSLGRYWTLTENGDLTVNVTFRYIDADIPTSAPSESRFKLQRFTGVFTEIPSTGDSAANTRTASGISEFSDWTIFGEVGPTAALVSVSGRVTTPNGRGVPGAVIILTDQGGNARSARTNSFGYYKVYNLAVGQMYIGEVRSKRSIFMPRTLELLDESSDFDFIALP